MIHLRTHTKRLEIVDTNLPNHVNARQVSRQCTSSNRSSRLQNTMNPFKEINSTTQNTLRTTNNTLVSV
jgi:hypothetical protein